MASEGSSCCVKFAKFILFFVNTLFFILGSAVIGISAYLLTNKDAFGTSDILNTGALWAGVIFGSAVLGLAIFGCIGAGRGDACCGKFFLMIYSTIVLVIVLAEIVAGVVVLGKAGQLGALQNKDITHKAVDGFDKIVGTFVNSTMAKCCVGKTFKTDEPICLAIKDALASADATDACDSEQSFQKACIKFLQHYMTPAGIGMIVIAVIELLCLGAACHVMCWAKRANKAETPEAYDPTGPYQPPSKHAGDLAYGGAADAGPRMA
jgi:hypothetical protein